MPQVSVIIPVFNSKATLKACLDSVLAAGSHFGNAEVIVIDHGSTDGSYEFLCSTYGNIAKTYQRKGGTIGSLRNYGAQLAQGEYLCFVDSDCVLSQGHLADAMSVFKQIGADATGCKYDLPPSPHWVEETWARLHRRTRDGYVNYLNAGNFIIKRSVFEQVGGFDERLPTDEDADLGQRLSAKGYRIYEAHAVSAVHLGNPKNLMGFFRKELWHGSGMFRMHQRPYRDKVLWATLLHACILAVAAVSAVFLRASPAWRVAILLIALLLVPSLSLSYRFVRAGMVYRPLRSLLLYCIFFAAKVAAMVREIVRTRYG